jgi:hypothetical protein
MATTTRKPATVPQPAPLPIVQNPTERTNYLTYALTPPAIATLTVLILGRNLGDTSAVLSVFFVVFGFTALSTVVVIFLPLIRAALARRPKRVYTEENPPYEDEQS